MVSQKPTYQAAVALFRQKAPGIIDKLMGDFPIGLDDAYAILGNIGHECFGFTELLELSPTVSGSRGGWGWCQWTGPRRRDFEAYCQRTGKEPAGDEANYAWLWIELKGAESAALGKLLKAPGIEAKTIAFCKSFLRPGIAHEDSRIQWAKVAQSAYAARGSAPPISTPAADKGDMVDDATAIAQTRSAGAGTTAGTAAGGAIVITASSTAAKSSATAADWVVLGVFSVSVILIAALGWWLLTRKARRTARALEIVAMQEGAVK